MSNKYALIIGNTQYLDPQLAVLTAPNEDAKDLAGLLRAQEIGDFDNVVQLENKKTADVRKEVARFFSKKKHDDLLVLYFSGHSMLDEHGQLYLAFPDTEHEYLSATAISSSFITQEMDRCRSRKQVLILDCCYSGAYARGSKGALGSKVGVSTAFEGSGYGRIVLTSSDSTQYSWEGNQFIGEAVHSLFTHYMIEGIRTGKADLNMDGWISLSELYDYIFENIIKKTTKQTPGKWTYKNEKEIFLVKSPVPPVRLDQLPSDLLEALESPVAAVREAIMEDLFQLLKGDDKHMQLLATEALKYLKKDHNRKISKRAEDLLEGSVHPKPEVKEPVKLSSHSVETEKPPVSSKIKISQKQSSSPGLKKKLTQPLIPFMAFLALLAISGIWFFGREQEPAPEIHDIEALASDQLPEHNRPSESELELEENISEKEEVSNTKTEEPKDEKASASFTDISAADKAKNHMLTAQSSAKEARADQLVKDIYNQALQKAAQAENQYKSGDFPQAKRLYQIANDLFIQALNKAGQTALAHADLELVKESVTKAKQELTHTWETTRLRGQKELPPNLLQDAEKLEQTGDRKAELEEKESLQEAITHYRRAKNILEQALEKAELAVESRNNADILREKMTEKRTVIKEDENAKRENNSYRQALENQQQGETAYQQKNYDSAANLFRLATDLFDKAAKELAERKVVVVDDAPNSAEAADLERETQAREQIELLVETLQAWSGEWGIG